MSKVTFTFCIQIYKKLGEYQILNLKTLQNYGGYKKCDKWFSYFKIQNYF